MNRALCPPEDRDIGDILSQIGYDENLHALQEHLSKESWVRPVFTLSACDNERELAASLVDFVELGTKLAQELGTLKNGPPFFDLAGLANVFMVPILSAAIACDKETNYSNTQDEVLSMCESLWSSIPKPPGTGSITTWKQALIVAATQYEEGYQSALSGIVTPEEEARRIEVDPAAWAELVAEFGRKFRPDGN